MSLFNDITQVKRLLEAGPVFKPASPENLANREANRRLTMITDAEIGTLADTILEIARNEADEIYSNLSKQNDYILSDEGVAEDLSSNEREFEVDPATGRLLEAKKISKKELIAREAEKAARIKSGRVYFEDLNDEDKQIAIDQVRNDSDYPGYDWWDGDIGNNWRDKDGVQHRSNGFFDDELEKKGFLDTEIHFSGFYSQGDGACFSCRLDVAKIVKAFKIALRPLIQQEIDAGNFYGRIETSGRYSHSNTMDINLEYEGDLRESKLIEARPIFKAATPQHLAAREAEKMRQSGPTLKKLASEVIETRKWLDIYGETLDKFRRHADGETDYHAGNYATEVSYKIKVYAWPSDEFKQRMETKGVSEERFDEYFYDQLKFELESFVGSEKNHSYGETHNFLTGTGLMADYPNLINDWNQTGSSGGWLTLELTDLGFDDFDTIEEGIKRGDLKDVRYTGDVLEDDLAFVVKFKRELRERIDALHEIDMKVKKGVKGVEKWIESPDWERGFMEHHDIEESKVNEAGKVGKAENLIFKPASFEQQSMRLYPDDPVARETYTNALRNAGSQQKLRQIQAQQQQEIARRRRAEASARTKAFYASLPYTYEDIIRLNVYAKIMDLEGIRDVTTIAMAVHRTTAFLINLPPLDNEYRVHANGYLRTNTHRTPGVIKKLPPANTLDEYANLMEIMYQTMFKFVDNASKEVLYYRYTVHNRNWEVIDTVYYKNKVDTEYVRRSLIRDGYSPDIQVSWGGIKKGERVRERLLK
jgi:hypothetical protein